ncbi:hypothetical protein [Pseudomonas sp. 8 R 14]|uniref:hypothetical protein n=1 Tax=Pseudomonas sp. 8 R 14 TaxID=1844092 RepID=UPI000811F583|nr:hypothetical protein [Pseudomonas sp. 8 R 14]CRM76756.1 hypothetical protein [Pseudomonas sp. 8 R 14]
MKKNTFKLSILFAIALPVFILCGSSTAAAQTTTAGGIAPEASARPPLIPQTLTSAGTTQNITKQDDVELKILKEKNLLTSEFQSSMISIIIWSLSAIVSTVLLLVGASLFTNFKLHDKDLQRVKEDYDAKIKIFQAEIEAQLAVSSRDVAAAQEVRSQQDLDRMLDQTSQVRSHFETVRASLEGKYDEVLKATNKSEIAVKRLDENLINITTELRRAESLIWEVKKVPTNFLISCLQGLDVALLAKNEYDIGDFIGEIKKSLQENFIDAQRTIDEQILEFFERRLKKLAAVRPDDEKAIRDLLDQCSEISSEP